ncbi:MAG: glycerol-3-phosphate 1-O-acyltransferase PlsY [Phycisphaerae bacterium]|nr:glycerol-3-phosphate 1-O-acyltransferase PlsY [Phycisphaerae bacterium]
MMSSDHIIWLALLGPVVAYLLGAIPFGLLLGLAQGVDIRKHGSGNIGATNAGRVLGLRYFFYAFALDFLKGLLPVLGSDLLTQRWHATIYLPLLTAGAAVGGHLFPIYLRFHGGKGVATSFGAVLGIWPVFTLAGIVAGLVFLLVFLTWRIISVASLAATVVFMFMVPFFGRIAPEFSHLFGMTHWPQLWPLLAASWLLGIILVVKHRSNIRRLLAGTEPRAVKTTK